MEFVRDFGAVLGKRGIALLSGGSLIATVGLFLASSEFWVAATGLLAVLLAAAIWTAHSYWKEVQQAKFDLLIEVGQVRLLQPKPESEEQGWLLLIHPVRITNRNETHHVSLEVSLTFETPGGRTIIPEFEGRAHKEAPTHYKVLESPVAVDPQRTQAGVFSFWMSPTFVGIVGPDLEAVMEKGRQLDAQLELHDHVTGKAITVSVPGEWPEGTKPRGQAV